MRCRAVSSLMSCSGQIDYLRSASMAYSSLKISGRSFEFNHRYFCTVAFKDRFDHFPSKLGFNYSSTIFDVYNPISPFVVCHHFLLSVLKRYRTQYFIFAASPASLLYSEKESKKISKENPLFFKSKIMVYHCIYHYFCV